MLPVSGNLTADGQGVWVDVPTGALTLVVHGNFGGGTLSLQLRAMDLSTNVAWTGVSITAAGSSRVDIGAFAKVRVSLTGATGPNLNWEIRPESKC